MYDLHIFEVDNPEDMFFLLSLNKHQAVYTALYGQIAFYYENTDDCLRISESLVERQESRCEKLFGNKK